jgi:hypothetical protein
MTIIIKSKDTFEITALKIELQKIKVKNYRPELNNSVTIQNKDYNNLKKIMKKLTLPRKTQYEINTIHDNF